MENDAIKEGGFCCDLLHLLEIAAANDLIGFKRAVEEERCDVDVPGLWYGRRLGLKKMGFEERTPLMVSALYGSKDVLKYILETGRVDVNKASGSDGATALHCAAAGGSSSSNEVVKLLLDASADRSSVDSKGNRPADVIASVVNGSYDSRRKELERMLNDGTAVDELFVLPDQTVIQNIWQDQQEITMMKTSRDGVEKKEYPIDLTLPDINEGIYGTDEFRMYMFKVKPCSRAYSHDWTECPFIHPGENARRRDPRKYHYSCVPCPEFRKGSCRQGDNCEYAHGIFECWLHPAQYRTRLCKDEAGCTRKVCFFAHKPEELRPLYASTGSAMPSPRSHSVNGSIMDMGSNSLLSLGSSSLMMQTSTPPMTPSAPSSPSGGWPSQSIIPSPPLQISGSRLRSARYARDMDLDMEILGLKNHRQQQLLVDDISGLSLGSSWNNGSPSFSAFAASSGDCVTDVSNRHGGVKPTNLEAMFRTLDPVISPRFQGLSTDQNVNQLRSTYPTSFKSSPVRNSSFGIDGTAAMAAAHFNSRSSALTRRSHSFIERNVMNCQTGYSSPSSAAFPVPSNISDWGSPDGRLDWGIQGDDFNKLRKSASFAYHSNTNNNSEYVTPVSAPADNPEVSWVRSPVKDDTTRRSSLLGFEEQQCHLDVGDSEIFPAWVEQMYIDKEQMVA